MRTHESIQGNSGRPRTRFKLPTWLGEPAWPVDAEPYSLRRALTLLCRLYVGAGLFSLLLSFISVVGHTQDAAPDFTIAYDAGASVGILGFLAAVIIAINLDLIAQETARRNGVEQKNTSPDPDLGRVEVLDAMAFASASLAAIVGWFALLHDIPNLSLYPGFPIALASFIVALFAVLAGFTKNRLCSTKEANLAAARKVQERLSSLRSEWQDVENRPSRKHFLGAATSLAIGTFLFATNDLPRYTFLVWSAVAIAGCLYAPRVVYDANVTRSRIALIYFSLASMLLALVPIVIGLLETLEAVAESPASASFRGLSLLALGGLFAFPWLVVIATRRAVKHQSGRAREGMMAAIDRATSANDRWLEMSSHP